MYPVKLSFLLARFSVAALFSPPPSRGGAPSDASDADASVPCTECGRSDAGSGGALAIGSFVRRRGVPLAVEGRAMRAGEGGLGKEALRTGGESGAACDAWKDACVRSAGEEGTADAGEGGMGGMGGTLGDGGTGTLCECERECECVGESGATGEPGARPFGSARRGDLGGAWGASGRWTSGASERWLDARDAGREDVGASDAVSAGRDDAGVGGSGTALGVGGSGTALGVGGSIPADAGVGGGWSADTGVGGRGTAD
ncbi:hypothetical protein K488DRAFT_74097, partial [Vararia minispora EC-137]